MKLPGLTQERYSGTQKVTWRYSVKIGDLVSVRYCHVENAQLKFKSYAGIVTDNTGLKDGTGECKVLTLNGKHDWSPMNDLTLIQHLKT